MVTMAGSEGNIAVVSELLAVDVSHADEPRLVAHKADAEDLAVHKVAGFSPDDCHVLSLFPVTRHHFGLVRDSVDHQFDEVVVHLELRPFRRVFAAHEVNVAKCYVECKHFAIYTWPMTSEDIQTNLRLPAGLKTKLKRAADVNKRSTNAEVVARLEESFSGAKPAEKTAAVDEYTLDLFADKVAEKVGQVLDEREKRRSKR